MNTKINIAAGVINIIHAVVLTVNTIIIFLCLLACIAMPLLLPIWFLPFLLFIPLFGFIFAISLAATVCNMIAGVGTVVASTKGGKISRVFAIGSLVVDGLFIPVNVLFLSYGVFSLSGADTVNWLTVLIAIAASAAVALTIVSIVLNSISLARNKVTT